jgi:hypothetical protein
VSDYPNPLMSPEDDVENFEIADVSAPTATADDIEKNNGFREVPPGDHILVVKGFRGPVESDSYRVKVGEQLRSYTSHSVRVTFCLPGDPRATVEDYFILPPANPSELEAYYRGVPTDKPDQTPGNAANKFYHFISRLGFPYPPGGKLPDGARRLGNWKGRAIGASVVDGGTYTDKSGATKKGWNKVKYFSYRPADHQAHGPQTIPATGTGGAHSSGRPRQASTPASVGLDNI